MIHKIERLASIGKYRNYQATGDVAFKKLTLFYADNGSGKTTLTSILRSLNQNNPELIRRRKSTNLAANQAAQIIQRNTSGDTRHTFNHRTGWAAPYPDIEIFDTHFVDENVYSGCEFNDRHKKQLHQFVIGAQGVAIQHQIEENKRDKAAIRDNITTTESQLLQQVGNNLTSTLISSFLSLQRPQPNNIERLIGDAETVLAGATGNTIIQTLQSLSHLNLIHSGIDINGLISDLETTTQTIQDAALKQLFANHCDELSNGGIANPEGWLEKGYTYLKNKTKETPGESPVPTKCPFCKHTIDDTIGLVSTYALQFNQEFNALVDRLTLHVRAVQAFGLEAVIQTIYSINELNTSRAASWSAYLPATVQAPDFDVLIDEELIRIELHSLTTILQQKLQNPSAPLSGSISVRVKELLQGVNSKILKYNQRVDSYNASIVAFKNGIISVPQAQAELDRLKRTKARFEPAIDLLCSQLIAQKQSLRTLETAYPLLVQQQQQAANTFFTSYKDRINHYLVTVFKTLFKIEDVVHVPPQGKATQSKIGYKLTIDGQDISFEPEQENNVKDCLSEGDKSTIALAFFLSKLDIDPGISNKILVFDDPLSSFDSNRRMYTVQLIKDLFPTIKQIIVLSHNEYFLYELSKGFGAGDKKTLRIAENYLTKASTIQPLVLETLVENEYFKHVKELEKFLEDPDLAKKDIVLGWLRNVLEAHLRFKFYRQLRGLPANNQTFGNLITTLDSQGVVFRNNANRAGIISKLQAINGISCKPHHGEPIPDFNTLGANPNTMNVTELAGFVLDTLNLIDNEI
ncbi:AAA family ATPase [Pontibacter vulgaris]|uniref:AAA family ATPase n=1 Tax=Pontibacter vulgaris TaxID=2905679 RepID=UPI001FA7C6D1|nr:AAA family ATPase [Pontibacter vulgaris]